MEPFRCPIAITASSAVTAAGTGLEPVVSAIRSGMSCLQPVPEELLPGVGPQLWGRAEQFKASDFMPPLKARKLDRCSQFAVAVAGLALAEAGITRGNMPLERIGIALGCGFGGIANSVEFLTGYFQQGVAGLSPLLFPNTVANAPASNASIEYGIKGPNITLVQRFCSAESAILAACRFIEEGRVDVMLAGGVDELTPLMMQGFAALGQLQGHARNFGEGCGMLVLERAEHAVSRGARIKGYITGIGTIGQLVTGAEQQGIDRLLPVQRKVTQLAVSGAEEAAQPFMDAVEACQTVFPGRQIGRSLAMGGVVLGVLTELLQPGEHGLQLAASPEGPYVAMAVSGGDPADA